MEMGIIAAAKFQFNFHKYFEIQNKCYFCKKKKNKIISKEISNAENKEDSKA